MRRQLIKLWLFYCYILGKVLNWAPAGKIKKGEKGGVSCLYSRKGDSFDLSGP